ncbi:hypothetical protein DRQ53_11405 [bacterium]|nr:MAG: hypothetical protein DRQ32_07260 [bacterium]RKZ14500.1 MAG: hypothetical protein DRQ53_11405 [bacterium]
MYLPPTSFRGPASLFALACLGFVGCQEASITNPVIPGGGQELILDYAQFEAEVVDVFTSRGCDSASCHGGGIRGTFQLSPASDKDPGFDFTQASLQVDARQRESSALLLKPLAVPAGGTAHGGEGPTSTFDSESDTDYQKILTWILAGELQ